MTIPIFKMASVGLLPSPLKTMIYRLGGAKIGKGVKFAPFSILTSKSIEVGDGCKFGMFSFISARDSICIGNRVSVNAMVAVDTGTIEIGDDSVIMEQTVVGGMLTSRSAIKIGKRVKIFPYCFINPTEPVTIDDDVGVGGSTYIFTHGTWKNVLEGYPAAFGPVHIEARVWLPWRVFIMPNVTIGEDVIVAASSTVTKSIPSQSVAFGSPAKSRPYPVNRLSSDEKLQKLHEIFMEFSDLERYKGESCKTEVLEDAGFTVTHGHAKIRVTLDPDDIQTAAVLVSVAPINEARKAELKSAGTVWFDIASLEAMLSTDLVAAAVLEFLGRYGIRFDRGSGQ